MYLVYDNNNGPAIIDVRYGTNPPARVVAKRSRKDLGSSSTIPN
nr:hypothetical protein Iba_chr03cCG1760 [Ipomoea batatas]